MAKGKRSTALFEVIQAAKDKENLRAKGGGFLTPSWWFKGKAARSTTQALTKTQSKPSPLSARPFTAPTPVETEEEPESTVQEPQIQENEVQETEVPEPVSMHIVEETPEPTVDETANNEEPAAEETDPEPLARPTVVTTSREYDSEPEETPVIRTKPSTRTTHRPVDVDVDRSHQLINLRLSFTSAAITSFGFIVVVALAILFGKSLGRGPAPAGAASIEEVKSGPSSPSVLNVTQGKQGGRDEPAIAVNSAPKTPQASKTPPVSKAPQKEVVQTEPKQPTQVTPPAQAPQQQTAGLAPNGKRIVGMQYVWVQSYADPLDADDARDALVKAGIDCTVEKGLWLHARVVMRDHNARLRAHAKQSGV